MTALIYEYTHKCGEGKTEVNSEVPATLELHSGIRLKQQARFSLLNRWYYGNSTGKESQTR